MLMNTPIRWNTSISAQVPALHAKWAEIRKGLWHVLLGYCFLVLMAIPGLFLLCYGMTESVRLPFVEHLALSRQAAFILGCGLSGGGSLLWYLLMFTGQLRCMTYAPQRFAAKDVLFCCVFCTILAAVGMAVGSILEVARGADNFLEGLMLLQVQSLTQPGPLVQLAGLFLVLVNLLLFTGFLRAVMKCLGPAGLASVAAFFWYVAFLAGASVGLLWGAGREVLAGLAIGWAVCLLWHVALVSAARRRVAHVFPEHAGKGRLDQQHRPKPPSGLHSPYVRLDTW
jgi:hypothetical protein